LVRQNKTPPDPKLVARAKRVINELVRGLADGRLLTPDEQVTVSGENSIDRRNHKKMRENFEAVIKAYNRALEKSADDPNLTADQKARLLASKIDPKHHDPLEYRTWAYAADSDGRDKATSLELYRGIYQRVKDGRYRDR
jgi:hypothetical protein